MINSFPNIKICTNFWVKNSTFIWQTARDARSLKQEIKFCKKTKKNFLQLFKNNIAFLSVGVAISQAHLSFN